VVYGARPAEVDGLGDPAEQLKIGLQLVGILGRTDRNQVLAIDTEVDALPGLTEGGDRF
jgi:hypothetical protein